MFIITGRFKLSLIFSLGVFVIIEHASCTYFLQEDNKPKFQFSKLKCNAISAYTYRLISSLISFGDIGNWNSFGTRPSIFCSKKENRGK